jgi:hypothetical protein
MASRIEELFEELAENWNSEEGQRYLDYQKELAEKTALTALGLLPLPGARALLGTKLASRVPGAEKLYGQVGQDFRKFIIPPLSDVGRRLTGRSGSGVGADVVGRNPLPKIKDPVVTKQGPRGPINIGQPPAGPPRPAPSRNTSLSETDQEMIKRLLIPPLTQTGRRGIPSTTTGRSTKSYMDTVRKTKLTEQQTNRRNFIQQEIFKLESMRRQGEATQANMDKLFKLQEELKDLNKLLN